jgi:hypothetical protein
MISFLKMPNFKSETLEHFHVNNGNLVGKIHYNKIFENPFLNTVFKSPRFRDRLLP